MRRKGRLWVTGTMAAILAASALMPASAVYADDVVYTPTLAKDVPDSGHHYKLQKDSYEATDTKGGYRHYKCTDEGCGEEYSYKTDPLVYKTNPKTGAPVTDDYYTAVYLPNYERMPDNEMHVFWSKSDHEWRVYTTGSHDAYTSSRWCGDDAVCWSAPVYDLTNWRFEGSIRNGGWYFACDFNYDVTTDQAVMYAFPFIGNKDEYRLWTNNTSDPGAYFDTPLCKDKIAGEDDKMQFDPAILTTSDGSMYVVHDQTTGKIKHAQIEKINDDRTAVEWSAPVLMEDGSYNPNDYEANTLDYIEEYGVYVLQYSYTGDDLNDYHPLAYCYTTDKDLEHAKWKWGGIITDNSGLYAKDLKTGEIKNTGIPTYSWDNNHGGLVKINGEWYVSNHRHTGSYASRQGFMEKVNMSFDHGELKIEPTEFKASMDDSITAYHTWDASITTYITPTQFYGATKDADGNYTHVAYIDSLKGDKNNNGFVYSDPDYAKHRTPIVGIENGVVVGYKYLDFGDSSTNLSLSMLVSRDDDYADGTADIYIDAPTAEAGGTRIGSVALTKDAVEKAGVSATGSDGTKWSTLKADMDVPVSGVHGVYFVFSSKDKAKITKFDQFTFSKRSTSSGGGSSSAPIVTPAPAPKPSAAKFTDVPENAYYKEAVDWAAENGITVGTGDGTTFSPMATTTRSEMVQFLYRFAGSPKTTGNISFSDVKKTAYYKDAVAWAAQNGITAGTGNGKFSPNEPCTRAQMAVFLYRMKGNPAVSGNSASFKDVSANAYYSKAVQWLKESGITVGTGNGTTFSPKAECVRAQMVQFLYRYSKLK